MSESNVTTDSILSNVEQLPTIPVVALQVGELVHDPRVSAQKVAEVMQRDPSLSAKVLKLVNSSYYAIPGGVSDVARAISFIGFNTLHQLVLTVSVMDTLRTPEGSNFNAAGLWLHCLGVAAYAETIAEHIGHSDPGSCFTAGLLHDIGKIALAIAEPEKFGRAIDLARNDGLSMARAERKAGLPPHDRVGSRLARKWRFPAPLLVPIQYHHGTGKPHVRRELTKSLRAVADITALADHLALYYKLGDSGSPKPDEHRKDTLERVGMSTIQVDKIYSAVMRRLEASKVFLTLVDTADSDPAPAAGGKADPANDEQPDDGLPRLIVKP